MPKLRGLAVAALLLLAGTAAPASASTQPALPIRAAFYYPWFPQTWTVGGYYTHYHPVLGYYTSSDQPVVKQQISAMTYAHVDAGIISWWGQGSTNSDTRVPAILAATSGSPFRWAFYYEQEGTSDPSSAQITSDLRYLQTKYGSDPSVLRVAGRIVVFVYAGGNDNCGMASRWSAGNTTNAYVVLKVFAGYKACTAQPAGWHQYAPAAREDSQPGYSYSISPGFWKANETTARLPRSVPAFTQAVKDMATSGAPWQLVTTFNEWGEGTSVENANSKGYATPNLGTGPGWQTSTGRGAYLDALHGAP